MGNMLVVQTATSGKVSDFDFTDEPTNPVAPLVRVVARCLECEVRIAPDTSYKGRCIPCAAFAEVSDTSAKAFIARINRTGLDLVRSFSLVTEET